MKQDYPSYTLRPPAIKIPGNAIEDAAGELRTCHTLLGMLCSHIESLQDQAKTLAGICTGVYLGQLEADLASAWALTDTIEDRLRNNIVMIDAAVDAMPAKGD